MKKLLFLIIPLILISACNSQSPKVCFNSNCFDVDLATTQQQQQQGLMHLNNLPQDKGMLFIFPQEDIYSFWMKNTLIPLDIIWINKENKVVYIERNAQPCTQEECPSIYPNVTSSYVLEINAGLAAEFDIWEGSEVHLELD